MLINDVDWSDLLKLFELWDVWTSARDAPEGSRLHRWRFVILVGVVLVLAPIVILMPLLVVGMLLQFLA